MALAAITFDHLGSDEQMAALRAAIEPHGIPATFFVTGEQAHERPQAVRALHDAGYEVGMHGWAHEAWGDLDPESERDLAGRATDAIAAASGVSPAGFRAPGGSRSAHTAEILGDLGYRYDASLGDGMRVSRLSPALGQVPFVWPGVDGYWYLRDEPADPSAVCDAWLASFEKTATNEGLFLTICHPEITGIDENRLSVLDAVAQAATADSRVELRTVGAIAARIPA